ncbi:MAG: VOC family protein [Haloferacaceae archaeon]
MDDDANPGSLPPETAVGRVALRVNDLGRVREFYESVVGLETIRADGGTATLGAGGTPLLRLIGDPDAPERGRDETGLFHTAVRVPSRAALADALERVEEWGLDGASDHLVSEALYFDDPEGNGVEVYRDRPRSEWPETDAGRVAMETLPLDLSALRGSGPGAERVPDGTDVGHVHLEVSSTAAARAFYVDALGLRVRQTYGDEALFLAAGDYHHHVGANVWNGRTAPATGRGLEWFELDVPAGAVDDCRSRLEAAGFGTRDASEGFATADRDGIELRVRPVD